MELLMDELAKAQATLKQALVRARATEDRALLSSVRELGERLANGLGALIKMGRIHAAGNRALDAPIGETARILAQMNQMLGAVRVVTVDDQVYVNDVRIRTEGVGSARDLGSELAKHDVGGLTFHLPLPEPQLRSLVEVFVAPPAQQEPRKSVRRTLNAKGLGSLELAGKFRFRTDAELASQNPAAALQRALRLVAGTWTDLAAGRLLNPLPLRRSVVELVGVGIESPELWEIPAEASPHVAHAVQVATTALLLARAVGLPAGALQDLGIAALLHDIGYMLPESSSPSAPTLQLHCEGGARLLLRQKGFHEAKIRRLRAIIEHHRDFLGVAGAPSTLGAILRVCEDYQNLVRLYAARASRSAILGAMVGAAGKLYHPALPQLLVNALGQHPPGTLMELSDGRLARSACPVRSAATFAAPLARVLDPRTRQASDELLDLAKGPGVRQVFLG
jgi:HD-GYP domain-containing protein (c-di-GMP phosphodiesterase class II)